ncbi:hypothetical protein DFH08DRAFT_947823 [Mycena albidolilacea]|uniref:Uncharacterized protein n=1 Tax=Mycena albidolilacea TaxID=1033008 RepID=A0AAD7AVU9_9AGAR|nr:hypothetical protein DFH08DRAFT_947823 [Mycena albidolilacea]
MAWIPPCTQPKIYQILIKIQKLIVLTTVAPSTSVAALKAEVLDALKDNTRDFELCRALKDTCGRPTGEYELLEDGKASLRDTGVANWEALFLRFRDAETGDLRPVEYVPYEDDDDAPPAPAPAPSAAAATAETSTSRGKRKARPD